MPEPILTMPDLFHQALVPVLALEGGKVDNNADPGGRTNKGITQTVYTSWRGRHSLPPKDVYLISDQEVEAIYRSQYWEPIHGDELPRGVGFVVFDGAVNSGPMQSVKWLQRALGFKPEQVDGIIGNITINAAKANTDNDTLIANILARREAFLRALTTFRVFGKGWLRRLATVKATGQAMASGIATQAPAFIPAANTKATLTSAKRPLSPAAGDASVGLGGGQAITAQITDQLQPVAGIPFIKDALPYIMLIGLVLAALGLAWRYYATQQRAKLADALDTKITT